MVPNSRAPGAQSGGVKVSERVEARFVCMMGDGHAWSWGNCPEVARRARARGEAFQPHTHVRVGPCSQHVAQYHNIEDILSRRVQDLSKSFFIHDYIRIH
jgi:hypothetical protein